MAEIKEFTIRQTPPAMPLTFDEAKWVEKASLLKGGEK